MKRLIWTAVILLSPLFCTSAIACGCGALPNQTPDDIKMGRLREFDRSAAVFTGEVVKVENGKAIFKIETIWKGGPSDEIAVTIFVINGDGTTTVSSCDKRFALGEKHLVYAFSREGTLRADVCGHSRRYEKLSDIQQEIEALNEINKPETRREPCRCGDLPDQTPEQRREAWLKVVVKSAAIFTGDVVRIDDGKATLKVDRIWKGEPADEIVMKISLAEEENAATSCDFPYKLGDKYLIYAWPQNGSLVTHLCSRSANFKDTKHIEREIKSLNEIIQPNVRNKELKWSERSPN